MLRAAALLLVGVLAVHELRYVIAFGGDAGETLAHHGHGYLSFVTPLVGMLSAIGLGQVLVRAAGRRPAVSPAGVRLCRLWPVASLALLCIYTSQELLEGLLAPGHPAGWAGVFSGGGWVAVPLAVAFGAFVALAVRVSRLVRSRGVLRIRLSSLTVPSAGALAVRAFAVLVVRCGVLAGHLAGRAPPVVFVSI